MSSKNKSQLKQNVESLSHTISKVSPYDWDELIPLREKQSDEYIPEIEEIIEYGEYIGLELPGDESLLYIAKEGITATLPPEWEACQTFEGEMLYRNLVTKEVTEEHPLDEIYRNKVLEIKKEHARIEEPLESEEHEVSDNMEENEQYHVLDAIEEEEKEDYSDSYASGRFESQEYEIVRNLHSVKSSSGKLSIRNHLRHEEEFAKSTKNNKKSMIPRLNLNLNEENNDDVLENNSSEIFKPYRLIESKDLQIKNKKNKEYGNFLAEFSEEYTFEQPNQLSFKNSSQPQYHPSLSIQLPTDFSHDESPEKPIISNPLHKPSPHNSSNQALLKIKELNQQLSQYKNEKNLKEILLDQIKSNNQLKIELIKEKLKKKNKHKKEKFTEKFQKLTAV